MFTKQVITYIIAAIFSHSFVCDTCLKIKHTKKHTKKSKSASDINGLFDIPSKKSLSLACNIRRLVEKKKIDTILINNHHLRVVYVLQSFSCEFCCVCSVRFSLPSLSSHSYNGYLTQSNRGVKAGDSTRFHTHPHLVS